MKKEIDLRSDTLTVPSREMLEAMIRVPVGDDGRALGEKGEDPTAAEVEYEMARLFGREDALFVPSGTMANTLCAQTHCRRGSRMAVADNMHLYRAEKVIFDPEYAGMEAVLVPQEKGVYDMQALEEVLKAGDIGLVFLENSYNFEGGRAISRAVMEQTITLAHQYGVPVHVDGARIFNAALALKTTPKELTAGADSVMFCVSKGLGAPVGSFVAGSRDFIARARRVRKMMGGQLRQMGYLAAAGRYAVEHADRLLMDHENAALLAKLLKDCPGLVIDMDSVQTNIVMARLTGPYMAREWLDHLRREAGVRAHYITDHEVRFVTWNGIGCEDVVEAAAAVRTFCENIQK